MYALADVCLADVCLADVCLADVCLARVRITVQKVGSRRGMRGQLDETY
jgi:hypothetical protein